MATSTKVYAAGAAAIGVAFVYTAIKGDSLLSVVQSTVKGQSPASVAPTEQITGTPDSAFTAGAATGSAAAGIINSATGNTGAATQTAAHNQAIAKVLAAPFGWSTGQQWTDLVQLWNKESGWSNTVENPSGAYGIAQALPNTKYPKAGQPPSEGGSADPTVQIAWGLSYILSRYGSPANAWAHETSFNWY
jgi:resuscitation-promoting factor RpfB